MGGACCGKSDTNTTHEKFQLRRVGNFTFKQHCTSHSVYKSSGKGCRQTAAWFTDATPEEVAAKRVEFWDTRVQGDPSHWAALKAACEAIDSGALHTATAEAIVKASGLTMQQGYILVCYDELGVKYELPPFVINEPTSYGQPKEEVKTPDRPGQSVSITVRSVHRPDVTVTINTNETGKKLKSLYAEAAKPAGPQRMFFNGVELKDGAFLTSLSAGVVVTAMGP